jgi:hypothetical protein
MAPKNSHEPKKRDFYISFTTNTVSSDIFIGSLSAALEVCLHYSMFLFPGRSRALKECPLHTESLCHAFDPSWDGDHANLGSDER